MICNINESGDNRLEELTNKFGQLKGLKIYLTEQANGGPVTGFDSLPYDSKPSRDLVIKREHYRSSAEAIKSIYEEVVGKNAVKLSEARDLRGNTLYTITAIRPIPEEYEAELASISASEDTNVFDKLLFHLKGHLRLKYKRLTTLQAEAKALQKSKDTDLFVKKRREVTSLTEDIEQFTDFIKSYEDNKIIESIKTISDLQLNWVNFTLSKNDISIAEINEINNIVSLWKDIDEILYLQDEPIPSEIAETFNYIKSKITENNFVSRVHTISSQLLADQAGYKSSKDLITSLMETKDISFGRGWTLDLSHTGVKLLNDLDKSMRDAFIRAELEFNNFIETYEALYDKIKNKNLNVLYQKDSKGEWTGNLTNTYTQEWYDRRRELYTLYKTVREADSKTQRIKAKRKLDKWLDNNMIEIDTRYFIQENELSKYKETYIKSIYDQYGKERGDELIDRALSEYDRYLQALEDFIFSNNSAVESGDITEEDAKVNVKNWKLRNNPEIYFKQKDYKDSDLLKGFIQPKNYFIVQEPKKFNKNGNKTNWFDSNFESIEKDVDMLNFYNFIKDSMDSFLSYIPSYLKKDNQINAGFLPRIKKELLANLLKSDLRGAASIFKEDWLNSLTSSNNIQEEEFIDPNTKKPYRTIPIAYISNIPVEERSNDLGEIVSAFAKMAITYKWKSKIEEKALLVNRFVDDIATGEGRKQYKSDQLTQLRDLMDYSLDARIYGKTKKEEGVSNIKLSVEKSYIPTKDEYKSDLDIAYNSYRSEGLSNEEALNKLEEEFTGKVEISSGRRKLEYLKKKRDEIEDKLYNDEITQEEYSELIKPLEEEANSMGKNLVWSKLGDKVLRYNQALALGFNPFSAINNYMFGFTSNIVWSAGNTDFKPKHMIQALGITWKSALNLNKAKRDKVANLMIKFNVLTESVEMKSDTINETLNKIKNAPYILLKGGDYMIKGQTFIAMMLHKKIKDINGIERSLFDAFDENGIWKSDEFGESPEWNGDASNPDELKEYIAFRNKVVQLNKKLHGNFDPNSPIRYKKYILGRMLAQFRLSWMAEGFDQRFGMRRTDGLLDRDVEGRYRTYYNLGFIKSLKVLGNLAINNTDILKTLSSKDRSIVEENMRRNLMEIYMYAIMMAFYAILKYSNDDDEEENWTVLNMLGRVMGDTTFYFSPNTFVSIIKDPLPVFRVYQNSQKGFSSAIDLMFKDDLTERQIERSWLNISNMWPYLNLYNKSKYMAERELDK